MKLTEAQELVLRKAKDRIDYARTHSFYDWYRHTSGMWTIQEMSDDEIDRLIDKRTAEGWTANREYYLTRYQWNRDGIEYCCHASSKTIQKLEKLGLIEIIHDSNGEQWGTDIIRILNY